MVEFCVKISQKRLQNDLTSCRWVLYYVPVRLPWRWVTNRLNKKFKKFCNTAWQNATRWYIMSRFAPREWNCESKAGLIDEMQNWIKTFEKKFEIQLAKVKNRIYIIERAKWQWNEVELKMTRSWIKYKKSSKIDLTKSKLMIYYKTCTLEREQLIENWIVRCKPWKFHYET